MDKAWLEQKIKECESVRPEIEKILREKLHLDDKEFEKIMDCLESPCYTTAIHELDMALIMKYVDDSMKTYMKYKELSESSGIEELFNKYTKKNWIDAYLDGEPMEFDGDIIITDPCYIMKEDDDWATCAYGEDMEALGITHYMTRDTLYGDWSCTTFDTDTKEAIGEFCADAGLVSVFLLDEVLKYNPYYTSAMISTSTATPNGRSFTATQERAGLEVKYLAYTSLNALKSPISAKKQVVLTT